LKIRFVEGFSLFILNLLSTVKKIHALRTQCDLQAWLKLTLFFSFLSIVFGKFLIEITAIIRHQGFSRVTQGANACDVNNTPTAFIIIRSKQQFCICGERHKQRK
jgi:hypothetical protein